MQRRVDEHDEQKQHQCDGKQRLPLQTRGIGHFACHRRCQKPHALEQARHIRRIAGHHHDRHRLADRSADAEHNGSGNAAFRCGHRHAEIGFGRRCPQRQRSVLIFPRHCRERRHGHLDDGRQNHDGKNDDRCQKARSVRQVKHAADGGHQNEHAHKTVDDRRDAGKQAHG